MGGVVNFLDELKKKFDAVQMNSESFNRISDSDMDRIEAELIRFVDELALAN